MKIFIFIFIFFIVAAHARRLGGNGNDKANPTSKANFNCDEGCSLKRQTMGPMVCGDDGITYFNECLAVCQVRISIN